ncbi:MAG: 50S ribosomal protein L10 [Candidatus Nanopelagicales bacterium]|jgi:large subunit ribosomal protein L10|nr:50S ribosomal protein L10 [Candidatus Nanopelagicales bacterium]
MARNPKSTSVAEITEEFRSSSAAVLTEYRGLTVAQLKELRRSLGGNATYAVVKNTLTKIAAKDAGVEGLDSLLAGPSAIAFVKGDPVEAAKGIRDFAKAHPKLVIKGGYLDGKVLSAADVTTLADLESREVLLAKLAGAMNASLQQAVSLFAAPLSQAARAIDALRAAAEADPSIIGGAGTSPAAAAATEAEADAPAPEVEAPAAEAAPEVEAPVAEASTDAAEADADAATPAEANAEASTEVDAPVAEASTDAAAAAEETAAG